MYSSIPFRDGYHLSLDQSGSRPETLFAGSAISMGGRSPLPNWRSFVKALLKTLLKNALTPRNSSAVSTSAETSGRSPESFLPPNRASSSTPLIPLHGPLPVMAPHSSEDYRLTEEDDFAIEQLIVKFEELNIPLYQITDIVIRRFGCDYLQAIRAAFALETGPIIAPRHSGLIPEAERLSKETSDIHLGIADDLLSGRLQVVITTNFDLRIENALVQRIENQPEIYSLMKLSLRVEHDQPIRQRESTALAAVQISQLASWCESDQTVKRVGAIIVPSWREFQLLIELLPKFATTELPFRFLLKIHGSADQEESCIDSNFQREQKLPSPVNLALWSIYANTRVTFLGFSGAELQNNHDYFQMLTAASFADLNIRWSSYDPDHDNPVVGKLYDEIMSRDSASSPKNQHQHCFMRPKAALDFGNLRVDLHAYQSHLDRTTRLTDKNWCCAALLDLIVHASFHSQIPDDLRPVSTALWSQCGNTASLERGDILLTTSRISDALANSLPVQETEMHDDRFRYIYLKQALDTMYIVCQDGRSIEDRKRQVQAVEAYLDDAEFFIAGNDYYGIHSDMWIIWAARYLLGVLAGYRLSILLRLLSCGIVSASITGNIEAKKYLEDLTVAIDTPVDSVTRNLPVDRQRVIKPPLQRTVAYNTHIYIVDMDNMSPSLYSQAVPYDDYLRGFLTYALLLKGRVVATQNIFNSRTLVTKVLCPIDPVTKKHSLNIELVSRIDVWIDVKSSAHGIRHDYEDRARKGTFVLDNIPKEALELLLDYYDADENAGQMIVVRQNKERSYWSRRFAKGVASALDHPDLIDVLARGPCPWLQKSPTAKDQVDLRSDFVDYKQKFKLHLEENEEHFSRSAAYTFLDVAPLPVSPGRGTRAKVLYAKILASVAIKHVVDAVYILNFPCSQRISLLASESSRHLLDLAAFAYGGHFENSTKLSAPLWDYSSPVLHYPSEALNESPSKEEDAARASLDMGTSIAALRAIRGADFRELYEMTHRQVDPPTSLFRPSMASLFKPSMVKARLARLPNRPSDVKLDPAISIHSVGAPQASTPSIAKHLIEELQYSRSKPVPCLYNLPRFPWSAHHYEWNMTGNAT